ncbi:hypothetical protein B0T26DRAFT_696326 [Lasiosphaeria miniovina]|uniref:Uncharacterized protein n=1 Tax=Lasiosphaeria miniovina TaxID=1954250 RepID=A0AA40B5H1_9PEZI|nr:uncharacterized protein B0T26DRAFT_696326 [Lasiosphaeria miniovina]KAK0727989.1 hypothetical protein B0T26DRAFT_696326 [Lasiosphaeria miniovina]
MRGSGGRAGDPRHGAEQPHGDCGQDRPGPGHQAPRARQHERHEDDSGREQKPPDANAAAADGVHDGAGLVGHVDLIAAHGSRLSVRRVSPCLPSTVRLCCCWLVVWFWPWQLHLYRLIRLVVQGEGSLWTTNRVKATFHAVQQKAMIVII